MPNDFDRDELHAIHLACYPLTLHAIHLACHTLTLSSLVNGKCHGHRWSHCMSYTDFELAGQWQSVMINGGLLA